MNKIRIALPHKVHSRQGLGSIPEADYHLDYIEAEVRRRYVAFRLSKLNVRELEHPSGEYVDHYLDVAYALAKDIELEVVKVERPREMIRGYYVLSPMLVRLVRLSAVWLYKNNLYWGWLRDLFRHEYEFEYKYETEYHHFYGGFPVDEQ